MIRKVKMPTAQPFNTEFSVNKVCQGCNQRFTTRTLADFLCDECEKPPKRTRKKKNTTEVIKDVVKAAKKKVVKNSSKK